MTDSAKIDYMIKDQVLRCSCTKIFSVIKVAEGQYRFGVSQKLRMVQIRSKAVIVRVGGGWEVRPKA